MKKKGKKQDPEFPENFDRSPTQVRLEFCDSAVKECFLNVARHGLKGFASHHSPFFFKCLQIDMRP